MRQRGVILAVAGALSMQLLGCTQAVVDAPNPTTISADEYDRVFDAAVEVLRGRHFVVDRKDRRFGVVTTRPLAASTFFEPWSDDNLTARQTLESTLNFERRTVRIEITPAADPAAPASAPATPPAKDTAPAPTADAPATQFNVHVIVDMDRRYHPPRRDIVARVRPFDWKHSTSRYDHLTTEEGDIESYWLPIGDDEPLARRLVTEILTRATAPQPEVKPAPVPANPPAAPPAP
jgi:hypothetical protein